MQDNLMRLKQQIDSVNVELGLPKDVLEKDFHMTRAIHAFSDLENEFFSLVFQGGTSLTKGHRIIQRMSEDCDFRIISKTITHSLGKEKFRRELRHFRHQILERFQQADFVIKKEKVFSMNMGTFMRVHLPYESVYGTQKTLREDILLEFTAIDTKTPIQEKPVTSLIQQTLGSVVNHGERTVKCVSIEETAAEKWVALTRRVANIKYFGFQEDDEHLVRHIYDLINIHQKVRFEQSFHSLITQIIGEDKQRYKSKNLAYYEKPLVEINRALESLKVEPRWQECWEHFTSSMVFESKKSSYGEAIAIFSEQSKAVIDHLEIFL